MQSSNTPTKIAALFASGSGALKNTIPKNAVDAANPNNASYELGFPPVTMIPLESGGLPPYGQDINGILNILSAGMRWSAAGGPYKYDNAFANDSSVGGYPKGAVLIKSGLGGFWFNTIENNTSNPDTGGAGWVDLSTILTNTPVQTSIAGLRTQLKTGPSFCFTSGYYASGDGGGGIYYYDSADVTSADNGGTIIVAADGGRWKLVNTGVISVLQFGAKRDGSSPAHTQIQAALDYIANSQTAQITAQRVQTASLFFPSGNYTIGAALKVRGFIGLVGVGSSYTGGSVIHQTLAATNIFEFYGSLYDHVSLGNLVQGLSFEFDNALSTSNAAYALYFPATDDIGLGTLSSNSHYIRQNRFGGWHSKGRFLFMANCNDVDLSSNVIDVCQYGPAIVMGGQALTGVSDVRIVGNNFYYCMISIQIHAANGVTISGNNFSTQFNGSGWAAIRLLTDNGTITAGKVSGVNIVGNSHRNNYNILVMDGSATNVNYSDNTAENCYNAPIRTANGPSYSGLTVSGNRFKLNSGYPLAYAPFQFAGGVLSDSILSENAVDCNGVTAVLSPCNDNTTASFIGTGCTFRDNKLINNSAVSNSYCAALVPSSASGLSIANGKTVGSFPSGLSMFTLSSLAVGDSMSADVAWDVLVNQSGVNAATRAGLTRVSILRRSATKYDATLISSVADDTAGSGGAVLPTVTWAVTTAAAPSITVTVSSSLTPSSVIVNARLSNFSQIGSPAVKCV